MTGGKLSEHNKTAPPIYKGGAVVAYMQLETPSEVAMAVRMLMAI